MKNILKNEYIRVLLPGVLIFVLISLYLFSIFLLFSPYYIIDLEQEISRESARSEYYGVSDLERFEEYRIAVRRVITLSIAFLSTTFLLLSYVLYQATSGFKKYRQIEEKLFEREDLLHQIMNTTPNLVFIKDINGKYFLANKALADLYGTSTDMILGKTDLELAEIYKISKEEAENCIREDHEVIESKESKFFPASSFTDRDGNRKWFQIKKVPFSSRIVSSGTLGVSLEITQRKLMEEALRKSEEEYRISIESSPYGILVTDPKGRILIFNSQLEKFTGYSKGITPDLDSFLEKICPDAEDLQCRIKEAILIVAADSPHSGEAEIVCKSGEKRICRYVTSSMPSDIRTLFFNDITKQKKLEKELHQAKKNERERITREIHDIIGYTLTNLKMMMEAAIDLSKEYSPRLTELVKQARDQAQEGLNETRLALHVLRVVDTDKIRGADAVQKLARVFEKATGVVVNADLGSITWNFDESVELILYRLVQEGMTNAFRHGKATRIEISFEQDISAITLRICDNGSGCTEIKDGIGFSGIRERIGKLGGCFTAGNNSEGFELSAWIPCKVR